MQKDPVCGMQVDPRMQPVRANTEGRRTTFAQPDAKRSLMPTQRSMHRSNCCHEEAPASMSGSGVSKDKG
jgi:YHS domain-containing protein